MAQDISQMISGIKASYNRTNLIDVNLEQVLVPKPETSVGNLLQKMPAQSKKDYAINFDPVEAVFLEKLVSQQLLDKRIIMKAEDFFKGILFLDYFTSIFNTDYTLIDDLYKTAKELEQRDQDLDPDLELVVKQAALQYFSLTCSSQSRMRGSGYATQRHRELNRAIEPTRMIARRISPLYEALGTMVCDLVHEPQVKNQLVKVYGLYDLKACVFADAILDYLHEQEDRTKIIEKIVSEDYCKGSVLAISCFAKYNTAKTFDEYIRSLNGGQR